MMIAVEAVDIAVASSGTVEGVVVVVERKQENYPHH